MAKAYVPQYQVTAVHNTYSHSWQTDDRTEALNVARDWRDAFGRSADVYVQDLRNANAIVRDVRDMSAREYFSQAYRNCGHFPQSELDLFSI